MKEEKVWGTAQHIFCADSCAVSVLEVNEGFCCSKHFHEHRINKFFVQSGEIEVVTYDPHSRVKLKPGDSCDIQPGVEHRFEVLKSGVVIEVYWPAPVKLDDIVRFDTGGKL